MNFVAEGRKHDAGMLADSDLLRDLNQYASAWLDNHFVFTGIPPILFVYTFNVHLEMEL